MLEIKSLVNISFEAIYSAFSEAFKDYEMQLNKKELQTMITRRGFDPELSFAAFEGEKIVAFTLNGVGLYNNERTAYDTGTGTIEEYRGQGLATKIFNHSIPHLKEVGISQYLLEVLQHNNKAVSVYKKIGFEVSREFNYFVTSNDEIIFKEKESNWKTKQIDLSFKETMEKFQDFDPSWQNSFDAVSREINNFKILGAFDGQKLTGYCICEPNSGDITQIAIDRNYRRKGIASALLQEAAKHNLHNSIKIINTIIGCTSITKFLEAHSITVSGKQFEMIKPL